MSKASDVCKRSCCWTPGFGHSTVRDHLLPTHPNACHCHDLPSGNSVRPVGSAGEVRGKTKGGGRRGVEIVAGLPNPTYVDLEGNAR